MKQNIVFGPIYSRRFGKSLGIDLSPKTKQCNFDCLYCELEGKKAIEEMEEVISVDSIITALQEKTLNNIDVLTITANGEPTLYPFLYDLIVKIKDIIPPHIKTLILSNGSKFGEKEVQKALLLFDKVKFSFDAGNQKVFSRIDRAHKTIDINKIAQGIKEFSKIYQGELFAEILFIKDINDKQEHLNDLVAFFKDIKLSRIDLSTIDRPPAYQSSPIDMNTLENIAIFLQSKLPHIPVDVPKRKQQEKDTKSLNPEEVLELIKRRPLEVTETKAMFDQDTLLILQQLLRDKKIFIQNVDNLSFYTIKTIK